VSPVPEQERLARAALSFLAEPGDPVLGALLQTWRPEEILNAVSSGEEPRAALLSLEHDQRFEQDRRLEQDQCLEQDLSGQPVPSGRRGQRDQKVLDRAFGRWRARLSQVPSAARVDAWEASGLRLVCPGEPEWPTQLDVLRETRPVVLWVRGEADLRFACLHSVAVVGARAATGYGRHVATEMSATLAERGWAVVSGGAYGIDGCAHRGALGVGGLTVAVLAGGLSYGYPKGHYELFGAIAEQGVLASEWPPDRAPTRPGFLVRNRVIAAISRGTVVVEAALRSGALNTARHARDLCRPLMAVPGPVTSEESRGCHEIIREWAAVCVTAAQDVIEHVSAPGEGLTERRLGSMRPRDSLDPVAAAVLEAVPVRAGSGPATIAVEAGVDLNTALQFLGALAAAGFVERCARGWRARINA
jgi:DNA processing protein